MANYFGYNPPFFGGHQVVLTRQTGNRILKNDLLQLLQTSPGERVMRPEWGTGIKEAVFDLNDEDAALELENNIIQAIRRFDNRFDAEVTVTPNQDTNTLEIRVIANVRNEPNNSFALQLDVPVSEQ